MMYRKKHNGFTLIEIVVVTCISTIVFAMIGSLIVFSMKMFASGVEDVQDTISISSLQDFLKSELEYATDIKIQEEKPDGEWRSFAFQEEDKVLVQSLEKEDNSIQVLNNFENFGSLEGDITFIQVSLVNSTSTNDSYAKIKLGDTTSYIIALNNASVSTANYTLQGNMKLYYRTEIQLSSITTDDSSSGDDDSTTTPEVDEIIPSIPDNVDEDSTDYVILNGDFFGTIYDYALGYSSVPVYKGMIFFCPEDGYWYQAKITTWISLGDISNNSWALKRLTTTVKPNDGNTTLFVKGDVIDFEYLGYEGRYECIDDLVYAAYPGLVTDYEWPQFWKKVDESVPTKLITISTDLPEETSGTALEELKEDLTSSEYSFQGEYDNTKTYQVGDIIKITQEASDGPDFVQYYRKVFDYDAEPGKKDSQNRFAWKLYSRKFSINSAYEKGDLVWLFQDNSQFYTGFYIVQQDYYDDSVSTISNVVEWIIYSGQAEQYFKQR